MLQTSIIVHKAHVHPVPAVTNSLAKPNSLQGFISFYLGDEQDSFLSSLVFTLRLFPPSYLLTKADHTSCTSNAKVLELAKGSSYGQRDVEAEGMKGDWWS